MAGLSSTTRIRAPIADNGSVLRAVDQCTIRQQAFARRFAPVLARFEVRASGAALVSRNTARHESPVFRTSLEKWSLTTLDFAANCGCSGEFLPVFSKARHSVHEPR